MFGRSSNFCFTAAHQSLGHGHLTSIRTKQLPKQPILKLSVTNKYFLRPNIKGSTKGQNHYSTKITPDKHFLVNSGLPNSIEPHTSKKFYSTLWSNSQKPNLMSNDKEEPNSNKLLHNHESNNLLPEKTLDIVQKDIGLGYFLKNVYLSSGLGFSGALATSLLLSPLMLQQPEYMIGGFVAGTIGGFGSIYFFNRTNPVYENKTIERFNDKFITLVPKYEPSKYISSLVLCGSMGLVMSPVVAIAGPLIVAEASVISLGIMAGSSLYALRAKPGSLLPYKSVAYGALTGLVGVGLVSILSSVFFGHGSLFHLFHTVDIYGGIVIFTAINAIDTQNAIDMYKNKQPDYLNCSIEMMLNAFNIFVRVLEILSKALKK
jgi:FtsH-binding integral membrane protein